MSVKELVEKKMAAEKRAEEARIKREERAKKKEEKEKKDGEVDFVISCFENRFFDIDSSKKKVAQIVHSNMKNNGSWLDIQRKRLSVLFKNARTYKCPIDESVKFKKWKKALEDKFEIKIIIREDFKYKRRFGNSGHETYPDRIYQGVKVVFFLED